MSLPSRRIARRATSRGLQQRASPFGVGGTRARGKASGAEVDGRRGWRPAAFGDLIRAVSSAPLLAVPDVSEGRDPLVVETIGAAFASHGARLLDTHTDPDHHRTVYTLTAPTETLSSPC